MKYVALFLLLVAVNVSAKDIAVFKNQANGYVVLTDEICTKDKEIYAELQRGYAFSDKGMTLEGCYYITEKETVRMIWSNGVEKIYPVDLFKIINTPRHRDSI